MSQAILELRDNRIAELEKIVMRSHGLASKTDDDCGDGNHVLQDFGACLYCTALDARG